MERHLVQVPYLWRYGDVRERGQWTLKPDLAFNTILASEKMPEECNVLKCTDANFNLINFNLFVSCPTVHRVSFIFLNSLSVGRKQNI